jgi:hypothetical protein
LFALNIVGRKSFHEKARGRITIVALEEPHKSAYSATIEKLNQRNAEFLELTKKYWTYTDSIISMTESEMIDLRKTKTQEYIVLRLGLVDVQRKSMSMEPGMEHVIGNPVTGPRTPHVIVNPGTPDKIINYGTKMILRAELIEFVKEGYYLYLGFAQLPIYYHASDVITGLNHIQFQMQIGYEQKSKKSIYNDVAKNSSLLKDKILLIDTNTISKTISHEKIADLYKYPFQLVGTREIQEAIVNNDQRYVYIYFRISLLNHRRLNTKILINAEDGAYIAYSLPSGANRLGVKNGPYLYKRNFEDFTKFVE